MIMQRPPRMQPTRPGPNGRVVAPYEKLPGPDGRVVAPYEKLPGPDGRVVGPYEKPNTGPPLPGPDGRVVMGGGMGQGQTSPTFQKPNTGPPLPGPNGNVVGTFESPNTGPSLPGSNQATGSSPMGGGMPSNVGGTQGPTTTMPVGAVYKKGGSVSSKEKKSSERGKQYTHSDGKLNLSHGRVSTANKNPKAPRF